MLIHTDSTNAKKHQHSKLPVGLRKNRFLSGFFGVYMSISFLDTFVQTISTGMPKLCVRTLSPRGSSTLSSSPAVAGARLWGEPGVASSGSTYSWKALTTVENKSKHLFIF